MKNRKIAFEMSSAASERFNPAFEAPSGSTNDENVSVELPSLNQDRHASHSENETGKEPWNADFLEKRTTQVFKVLQLLGLVTGGRHSQKLRTMSGVTYVATFNAVIGSRLFRKQVTLVPLPTSKL